MYPPSIHIFSSASLEFAVAMTTPPRAALLSSSARFILYRYICVYDGVADSVGAELRAPCRMYRGPSLDGGRRENAITESARGPCLLRRKERREPRSKAITAVDNCSERARLFVLQRVRLGRLMIAQGWVAAAPVTWIWDSGFFFYCVVIVILLQSYKLKCAYKS